jgi:hypothetical protein
MTDNTFDWEEKQAREMDRERRRQEEARFVPPTDYQIQRFLTMSDRLVSLGLIRSRAKERNNDTRTD